MRLRCKLVSPDTLDMAAHFSLAGKSSPESRCGRLQEDLDEYARSKLQEKETGIEVYTKSLLM